MIFRSYENRRSAKQRTVRASSIGGFLLLAVVSLSPLQATPDRIVAVGDIHGGIEGLVTILHESGLIDDQQNWSGGSTTMVQTGDFLDRGLGIREAMDLLRKLQEQAPAAGGQVVVLFGNHEATNLLGFRNDVNPEVYAQFATDGSLERQEQSWQTYVSWRRQRAKAKNERKPRFSSEEERLWKEAHPPGYLEYGEAISAGGEYGRWLRTLDTAARFEGILFVHGGIPPSLIGWSVDEINRQTLKEVRELDTCRAALLKEGVIHETSDPYEMVREGTAELARLNKRAGDVPEAVALQVEQTIEALNPCVDYQEWLLVKEESPVWYRGYARWTDEEANELLPRLLAAYGVEHFVIAHTTQPGEIDQRFGGRVFVIDTGMLTSFYPGGRPSALEIEGGKFTAIYPGLREPLGLDLEAIEVAESAGRYLGSDGHPLPFENDQQVLEFLTTAEVTGSKQLGKGINHILRLSLEKDGVRADAAFRDVEVNKDQHRDNDGRLFVNFKDSFRYEPAAYLVDHLLGIDRVPPAALYRYEGKRGSIQLWINNVIDEDDRREQGLEPPDSAQWLFERATRKLFDNLIFNIDRNQGNIMIDLGNWQQWLIDHGRAFLLTDELLAPDEIVLCPRHVWQRLQAATEAEVRTTLEAVLSKAEIDALWARWQKLVALLAERIETHGEASVLFGPS